jgi:hypothetical protein
LSHDTDSQVNNRVKTTYESIVLAIINLNVRSLKYYRRVFCQFLDKLAIKFHVIISSEAWSTNIEFNHNILTDYDFHYPQSHN